MDWIALLLLLLFLSLSAFFSSSEIAFFSLSREKVRSFRHSTLPRQKSVYSLLSRSRDLLVLIFFLNTLINILIQNSMSHLFEEEGSILWLKIFAPFVLVLCLGEYLPKYLGLHFSERLALFAAPAFALVKKKLERPLQLMTRWAENSSSVLFFFLKPEPPMTEREISHILQTSQDQGLLTSNEASLIGHVMELKKSTVGDVSLPLSELPRIQTADLSLDKLHELYASSPHRLIMIIQGSAEEMVGIIDASLLSYRMKDRDMLSLLEQAKAHLCFVPTMMHIDRLLSHLYQSKTTYAALYDEHNRIVGVASQKGILSQLLPKTPFLPEGQKNRNEVPQTFSGTTLLDTINVLFDTHLRSEHEIKTLSGWLIEVLDTVPTVGTSYVSQGLLFRVLASDEKTVSQVMIQLMHPTTLSEEEKEV